MTTSAPILPEDGVSEATDYRDDFDIWMGKHPRIEDCQIKIVRMDGSRREQGTVMHRNGIRVSEEEIAATCGGGEYEARVMQPCGNDRLKLRCVSRRALSIPGPPKALVGEVDARSAPMPARAPNPQAETAAVRQLGTMSEVLLKDRLSNANGGRSAGVEGFSEMRKAYSESQQAAVSASERRAELAERRAAETEAALRDLREATRAETDKLRQDLIAQQNNWASRLDNTGNRSGELIAALVPTLTDRAQENVQRVIESSATRITMLQEQHGKELTHLHQMYQTREHSVEKVHEAMMTRLEATHTVMMGHLQRDADSLRDQLRRIDDENRSLRDQVQRLHSTQLDPLSQLTRAQQLADKVRELVPQTADDGGLSSAAPDYLKVINNVVSSAGPIVAEFMQGRQQQQQQPARVAQAQVVSAAQQGNPQAIALMQQQAAAMQQQRALQQASTPAAPARPRGTMVKREDLVAAVNLLEMARRGGTSARQTAAAAVGAIDNGMLRELARRPPEQVIEHLTSLGILQGELSGEGGSAYVKDFLLGLREELPPRPLPSPER